MYCHAHCETACYWTVEDGFGTTLFCPTLVFCIPVVRYSYSSLLVLLEVLRLVPCLPAVPDSKPFVHYQPLCVYPLSYYGCSHTPFRAKKSPYPAHFDFPRAFAQHLMPSGCAAGCWRGHWNRSYWTGTSWRRIETDRHEKHEKHESREKVLLLTNSPLPCQRSPNRCPFRGAFFFFFKKWKEFSAF